MTDPWRLTVRHTTEGKKKTHSIEVWYSRIPGFGWLFFFFLQYPDGTFLSSSRQLTASPQSLRLTRRRKGNFLFRAVASFTQGFFSDVLSFFFFEEGGGRWFCWPLPTHEGKVDVSGHLFWRSGAEQTLAYYNNGKEKEERRGYNGPTLSKKKKNTIHQLKNWWDFLVGRRACY